MDPSKAWSSHPLGFLNQILRLKTNSNKSSLKTKSNLKLKITKQMNLKLGGDEINEEDKFKKIENPNSNSGSEKVHDLEIKEDE